LVVPLTKIWAVLGSICGKRVAAAMAGTLEALERHGELSLTADQRAQLLSMSARIINRRLAEQRRRRRLKGRAMTRPGTLLRSQIPVRTFADWGEAVPGFLEIDLVAQGGGDPRGPVRLQPLLYRCGLRLDLSQEWCAIGHAAGCSRR
jgi:hypothetical protein